MQPTPKPKAGVALLFLRDKGLFCPGTILPLTRDVPPSAEPADHSPEPRFSVVMGDSSFQICSRGYFLLPPAIEGPSWAPRSGGGGSFPRKPQGRGWPHAHSKGSGGAEHWHWQEAAAPSLHWSLEMFPSEVSGSRKWSSEQTGRICCTHHSCPVPSPSVGLLPALLSAPPPGSIPPHPGTAAQQPAAMLQPGLGRTRLSLQALPSGLGPGAQGCVTAHKITRGSQGVQHQLELQTR